MDDPARQLSITLDSVARAVAEWTVTRHAELDPSLPTRYGKDWRRLWVVDTRMRVRQLAQAIAARRPQLIIDDVAWARVAHAALELDVADVDTNLGSLRDVLAREAPEPVRSVAVEYATRALEEAEPVETKEAPRLSLDQPHGELALQYLEAILSGRRRYAESLMTDAIDAGVSARAIYRDVLTPTLREIGLMWHRGEITVADEHIATMAAENLMSVLRLRFRCAAEHNRRMLATAVGGELHCIGVRMVADFFEMDGWHSTLR